MSIFNKYEDEYEPGTIDGVGIEELCQDFNIHLQGPRVYILAWKMDAVMRFRFTRAEFLRGFSALGVDTVQTMSFRLMVASQELRASSTSFKEFYKWCFNFALDTEAGERSLPLDQAVSLWRTVFAVYTTPPALLQPWLTFLMEQPSEYPIIARDTWSYFLKFVVAIGDDSNKHNDNDAWPNVIDDFVEHLRYRQSKTIGSNSQSKVEPMIC